MRVTASRGCEASTPQVTGQAGRREQEALGAGDGHHGAAIGGGIDPLLQDRGCLSLGQKSY